jgi:hypothetical protein
VLPRGTSECPDCAGYIGWTRICAACHFAGWWQPGKFAGWSPPPIPAPTFDELWGDRSGPSWARLARPVNISTPAWYQDFCLALSRAVWRDQVTDEEASRALDLWHWVMLVNRGRKQARAEGRGA